MDRWLSWSGRRNGRKPLMYRRKLSKAKSGMALNRRRSKWLISGLFLPLPYAAYPSKLRLIQSLILVSQWRISAIDMTQFGNVFLTGLLLNMMMQSLIDWLNEYSWLQLPCAAPVSVLGHSWPTFSLFLPVHSSLFTLLWAECFISSSVQNARGCQ